MPTLLVVAFLVGIFLWLVLPRRKRTPAPEDDVTTPIDEAELAAAERQLAEDPEARSLGERAEEAAEDDWGPGTR